MPQLEIQGFERDLGFARDMVATNRSLSALSTGVLDLSDLLRMAHVQGVSALDYYVHAEVRARLLTLTSAPPSAWPEAAKRFRVSLESAAIAAARPPHLAWSWLEAEIEDQHGWKSFQAPDKIAEAFRLVSDAALWVETAKLMGASGLGRLSADKVVKNRLEFIVDRRNKIVHEADLMPASPRTHRYPIDADTVDESLDFIDSMVHAIHAVL